MISNNDMFNALYIYIVNKSKTFAVQSTTRVERLKVRLVERTQLTSEDLTQ